MFANLTQDDKTRKVIIDLLKAQEDGRLPSSCQYKHHIHTPFALCEEILSKLEYPLCPDEGKYLVMFNIEFLYALQKFIDIGEERVYYYTTDTTKARLAKKLFPGVEIVDDLDDPELYMKFDVVVGNPPYQDATAKSSKKMWPEFLKKAMDLILDNGYLGMITPSSWMAGKSDIFDIFKQNQCEYLCTDGSAYFPTVGTTISYYLIKKSPVTNPTPVNDHGHIDFRTVNFIPRGVVNSIGIFSKMAGNNTINVNFDSFCHSQRIDRITHDQSASHTYPNKHGSSSILWSNIIHPAANKNKVMFYMSGTPKPFYDNGIHGITEHHAYIHVTSTYEAENIISFLTSKLIKFLIKESTFAQAWNKVALKLLPAVDFTRSWTDAELYKHFNLTQDEIDYVEANV